MIVLKSDTSGLRKTICQRRSNDDWFLTIVIIWLDSSSLVCIFKLHVLELYILNLYIQIPLWHLPHSTSLNIQVSSEVLKIPRLALTGWLSWLKHRPISQKVVGSIPGQDTYLDCRFNPQSECMWEATHWCFSLSLSQMNKHILEWGFKKIPRLHLAETPKTPEEIAGFLIPGFSNVASQVWFLFVMTEMPEAKVIPVGISICGMSQATYFLLIFLRKFKIDYSKLWLIDFIIGGWYPPLPSSTRGVHFPAHLRLGLASGKWTVWRGQQL